MRPGDEKPETGSLDTLREHTLRNQPGFGCIPSGTSYNSLPSGRLFVRPGFHPDSICNFNFRTVSASKFMFSIGSVMSVV